MSQPEYISIEQSKLYHLGRKRDLAELLGLSLPELNALTSDANVKEWVKKTEGKKDRTIEEPLPPLGKILSSLYSILSRVETPDWLLSGKKGVKPKDNAEVHRYSPYMISTGYCGFLSKHKTGVCLSGV